MVHLENSDKGPQDAQTILARSRELTQDMVRVVRDVRVASAHIEIDISVKGPEINKVLELWNPIGVKIRARQISESEISKEDAIRIGVEYFNSERFWESHEAFEGVWLGCERGTIERDMVQGIILAAAALVHHQKDQDKIALSILRRAAQKLEDASPECYGIDIDAIRQKVDSEIASGNPEPFMIRPSLGRS